MIEINAGIDIDFCDGTIEGDFEAGEISRLDMAVMLETIAQKLRDTADPVVFVNYDTGTIQIG